MRDTTAPPFNGADGLIASFVTPTCRRFFDHWKSLIKGGLVPQCSDFFDRPPYDLIGSCFIFEVLPEGLLVRFMGSRMTDLWQDEFTGLYLGSRIAPALSKKFQRDVETICRHPVGLRLSGETNTSLGRTIDVEAICLPLAVQNNRPPRCVRFSQALGELKWDERKTTFVWNNPEWIDLGAGKPSNLTYR